MPIPERKVYSLLRIARELDELRQIRTAFMEGGIPWTRTREILKIVTPTSIVRASSGSLSSDGMHCSCSGIRASM